MSLLTTKSNEHKQMINISMTYVKHIEEVVKQIFSFKKQTWLFTFDNITVYQTRRLMSVCVELGEQGEWEPS